MNNTKPFAKLRGLIKEKYGTQGSFATAMEIDDSTLSKKLNEAGEWTRTEMETAGKLLGIPLEELHLFFYA